MKGVNLLFSHKDAKTQSFFFVTLRLRGKQQSVGYERS